MARALRRLSVWWTASDWRVYLIVLVCFVAGMVIGGWAATGLASDTASDLQYYIRSVLIEPQAGQGDVVESIRAGVIDNLLVFGAVYFLGLTVIGAPVVLGILFVRGFALGFAAWFVLASRELGVGFALLSFLPHNILLIPALLVAAAASLSFTVLLISRGFNNRVQVWRNFVRYTAIIAATVMVGGTAAILEHTITPYLLRLAIHIGGAS